MQISNNTPAFAHPELILNEKSVLGFPFYDVLLVNPNDISRHPSCSCNIISEPHIAFLQNEFKVNFQPAHSGMHSALFLKPEHASVWKDLKTNDQKTQFFSQVKDLHNYSFGGWHSREAHVRNGTHPVPVKVVAYELDLDIKVNEPVFLEICGSLVKQGSLLNSLFSQDRILQYDVLNTFHVLRQHISRFRRPPANQRLYHDLNSIGPMQKRDEILSKFSEMVGVPLPNERRTSNRWFTICSMSEDAWVIFQKIAFVKYNKGTFRNLSCWEVFARLSSESVHHVSRFFFQHPQGYPSPEDFFNFIMVRFFS
jgi:hypothetical protein